MPTTRGDIVSLYVRPRPEFFRRSQRDELARRLRTLDADTTTDAVSTMRELQLNDDGTTKFGGYRYTAIGFSQVTQLLARGLSNIMPDISGMVRRRHDAEYYVNGPMAVRHFNEIVDLRFNLLANYRLLRNERAKLIEGLVGARQRFLDNLSLFELAERAVHEHHPDVSLHTGVLLGRRMALWYRGAQPLFTVQADGQPWPFYAGYYLCNGEATGTSVRGTLALLCREGVCLGPYRAYGDRVTHAGKDFQRRLVKLFDKTLSKEVPTEKLAAAARRMVAEPLGFAGLDDRQRKAHVRRLAYALHQIGVQKNLATEAVEQAVCIGRDQEAPLMPHSHLERSFESRTRLDLFVPLLRMARRLDLDRREKIEQAAFTLLTGKLHV